jgi:hypothetical protein
LSNLNDKDLLVYDAVNGKWINGSIETILQDYALDLEEPTIVSIINETNDTHDSLIDQ